jgi:hypothetical protein
MVKLEVRLMFKVLMVINIHVVFWVVLLCTDVVGYQHFGGPCWFHLQDEVGIGQGIQEGVEFYLGQ